ncbi:cytochrome P450 2J6-like isoform X2 [Ctenopharyngodon idella]|uniref:cytochrome P450 2J6-like isoform X2 n=1 Tax=Ctenopharyngodon idella TaxID=7959 RepID=UPI0022308E00|nr:cytochrome P450 2J6-like isoform X2 [Ctenopharyngodon idella]
MALTAIHEILDFKGLLLFVVAFLLVADYLKNRNPPNYPPSPFSLPLLGNIFNMDSREPHIYLTKLGHAYNNIFSLRLGRDKVVFITGYKMVKEALVTQAENFVDRPYSPLLARVYSGNAGLFFSNGQMWKKQRHFALSTLRNFGLGKKTMELAICEESRFLLDEMDKQKEIFFQLYEAFPGIMKHLPGPHNDMFSNYKILHAFVREFIIKHKAELDPSEPRDYIDSFLIEMMEKPHETADGFDEQNLVPCVLDLFLAGTETTSTTLCWGLIYLITYPEVQEKVHEEKDRVIGRSREPSIADKANMPFTEAVIHEILRFGDIVPMNGLRVADKDTTLGECFIPKEKGSVWGSSLLEWNSSYFLSVCSENFDFQPQRVRSSTLME